MDAIQFDPIRNDGVAPTADRLLARREAYALHIAAQAGISAESGVGADIVSALRSVQREAFMGSPPWRLLAPGTHAQTISEDPGDLYDDVLVSLAPGVNSGQPSLHAACLFALRPAKGGQVVHVGAGTGYYTAILAEMVGPMGRVDGYEIEPALAEAAKHNLAGYAQVELHARSGAEPPLPACDALYVNAGSPEPLAVWLDALKPGGRLLFPLAPGEGPGDMLLVTRKPDTGYAARFLGGVEFIACVGTQNPEAGRRLARAFRRGNWKKVKSLHRFDPPDASCWIAGRDWWLSTSE